MDEIFKGTNTIERISLAKSILLFLNNKESLVVASSHDLELLELLKEGFNMFYFTEAIENSRLLFDHKIKTGTQKTRNAIKLIEMRGFPSSIIMEALNMSKVIEQKSNNIS